MDKEASFFKGLTCLISVFHHGSCWFGWHRNQLFETGFRVERLSPATGGMEVLLIGLMYLLFSAFKPEKD